LLVTFVGTRNFNKPCGELAQICIEVTLWGPVTSIRICASLNHRKKIWADPSADFTKSLTVNREVSIVDVRRFIFLELMPAA